MKAALCMLIVLPLVFASCAYTLPYGGASVEASNGMIRGGSGSTPPMRMTAGSAGTMDLAKERADKSKAFNTLPK